MRPPPMLVRFYMSPPANPGGLAFSRRRNRKDRSDSTFSIAPIRQRVNGTEEGKSAIRKTMKNRCAALRPGRRTVTKKNSIRRGDDVDAAVLLPAGFVVLVAGGFVFDVAHHSKLI